MTKDDIYILIEYDGVYNAKVKKNLKISLFFLLSLFIETVLFSSSFLTSKITFNTFSSPL